MARIALQSRELIESEEYEGAGGIKDVYDFNFEDEFKIIRRVIQKCKFVAIDTEFPGIVVKNVEGVDKEYSYMQSNVNSSKLIQLGLSFFNEEGKVCAGDVSTWQFHFKFDIKTDNQNPESIEVLSKSNVNFAYNLYMGVDPMAFADLLISSGVVLNEEVTFIGFHTGFDFGYLLKMLTNTNLPDNRSEFFEMLGLYFPVIYDIKYLVQNTNWSYSGLQDIGDALKVERQGTAHQAGSDALFTGNIFFALKKTELGNKIVKENSGYIFPIGKS